MIADGKIADKDKLLEGDLEYFYSTLKAIGRLQQAKAKAMQDASDK